jgi:hypothetical protein
MDRDVQLDMQPMDRLLVAALCHELSANHDRQYERHPPPGKDGGLCRVISWRQVQQRTTVSDLFGKDGKTGKRIRLA